MAEKLGNGGHSLENYDPATGRYIEDGKPNNSYDNPNEKTISSLNNGNNYNLDEGSVKDAFIPLDERLAELDKILEEMGITPTKPPLSDDRLEKSYDDLTEEEVLENLKDYQKNIKDKLSYVLSWTDLFHNDKKYAHENLKKFNSLMKEYPIANIDRIRLDKFYPRDGRSYYNENTYGLCERESYTFANRRISLNSDFFDTSEKMIEKTKQAINRGWSMPCSEENYICYTLTHEYGHAFFNDIVYGQKMRGNPNYENNEIRKEILAIFKEKYPGESVNEYASDYSRSNSAEFLAEVFANMALGKPNKLGECMSVWIERNKGVKYHG